MRKFTYSLAATLAALLAAPAAHAQNSTFATTEVTGSSSEVASVRTPDTNVAEAPAEAVRHLSASDEATTAAFYNDSHKDLAQSLAWMQETNALHPEYWSVYAEARIRLQLKDYAGAQATAAEAKKLALAAANADYARRSDEVIAQAKAKHK